MNRRSLIVRLGRFIQSLPLSFFLPVEKLFLSDKRSKEDDSGLIFVLALPRSGSTLTYQAICHGFKVQYLTNLWNLFFHLPYLGGILSNKSSLMHRSDFKSSYGFVSGFDGPAEGLKFWKWWLGCGLSDSDCVDKELMVSSPRIGYLRRALYQLTSSQTPFVSTYLGHALIPDELHHCFPKAVLIRLKRDPVDNALSLLRSMRDSGTEWFSVTPSECHEDVVLTEHQRVAAQVYWLNRRLDDALCGKLMLEVNYEDLCDNPEVTLARIKKFCVSRNIMLQEKFSLPSSFVYKHAKADDQDVAAIKLALHDLEKEHGELKK